MMPTAKPTTLRGPNLISLLCVATIAFVRLEPAAAQQLSAPAFDAPRPVEMRHDPATAPANYTSTPSPIAPPITTQPPQLLTPPGTPAPAVEQPVAVGLTPPDAKSGKKLALPGSNRAADGQAAPRSALAGGISGVFGVLASLGVVLGLFLGMAWLMRRGMPKQGRLLPREAVESLGRIPFPGRQQGQLLRVGNKIVLVSFSNSGADVITEITDPLEVDRLSGLCAQADRYSSVKTFRDVVDQFFGEKTARKDAARKEIAARPAAPRDAAREALAARIKERENG